MDHTFSVVIPAYNEENTILSILEQVLGLKIGQIQLEMIIINDCSTDGTRALVHLLSWEDLQRGQKNQLEGWMKGCLLHSEVWPVQQKSFQMNLKSEKYQKYLVPAILLILFITYAILALILDGNHGDADDIGQPFVRNEALVILPLFFVALVWLKQRKAIPFLAFGFVFYSIVGELLHYVTASKYTIGSALSVLVLAGLVLWILDPIVKPKNAPKQWLMEMLVAYMPFLTSLCTTGPILKPRLKRER